jgi:hypothetical protein
MGFLEVSSNVWFSLSAFRPRNFGCLVDRGRVYALSSLELRLRMRYDSSVAFYQSLPAHRWEARCFRRRGFVPVLGGLNGNI